MKDNNRGSTAAEIWGISASASSANLELYEGVEETVIDLYSAVRNGYLQKREAKIKE